MNWLNAIFTLLAVVLGWGLSEGGRFFSEKRQDKRNLRKLLFFLLELKLYLIKEASFEKRIEGIFEMMPPKFAERLELELDSPQLIEEINRLKPKVILLLTNSMTNDRLEFLSNNIDNVLVELSEIFPLLAYDLIEKHDIKNRLSGLNSYFNELQKMSPELVPSDFHSWFKPQINDELIKDLNGSIKIIASKIDNLTANDPRIRSTSVDFEIDKKNLEVFINEALNTLDQKILIENGE